MIKNYSEYVKRRLKASKNKPIRYTKHYLENALNIRKISKHEVKQNLRNPSKLKYAERQKIDRKNLTKETYLSHFIYSKNKGLSVPIKFNKGIKILTTYRPGKKTIRKIKRKFKK